MTKQVIIMRTDLNMRKGKMCAQSSHASMKVFLDMMSTEHKHVPVFQLDEEQKRCSGYILKKVVEKKILFYDDCSILEWMDGSFTKIVLGCDSEQELLNLKEQADNAGIINALILDNGQTEFKETCSNCGGLGWLNHFLLDQQPKCMVCHGTGKVNKPTYTCLAIGPDYNEKIDQITKELKLL